jgi:hypothetical protein
MSYDPQRVLSILFQCRDIIGLAVQVGVDEAERQLVPEQQRRLDEYESAMADFEMKDEVSFSLLRRQAGLLPSGAALLDGLVLVRELRRQPNKVLERLDRFFDIKETDPEDAMLDPQLESVQDELHALIHPLAKSLDAGACLLSPSDEEE